MIEWMYILKTPQGLKFLSPFLFLLIKLVWDEALVI